MITDPSIGWAGRIQDYCCASLCEWTAHTGHNREKDIELLHVNFT